jgi:hypothetical protein
MNLTHLFTYLGAPLTNSRWSWGAIRNSDGAVFLRVWQDEGLKIEGRPFTRITANAYFANDRGNLGFAERGRHIEAIRAGAKCYLIMCYAQDVEAEPRVIGGFDDSTLFEGGELREVDGETCIERLGRVPRATFRAEKSTS